MRKGQRSGRDECKVGRQTKTDTEKRKRDV